MLQVVFAWGVYCFGGVIDLLLDCFVGWVVLRWFYVGLRAWWFGV